MNGRARGRAEALAGGRRSLVAATALLSIKDESRRLVDGRVKSLPRSEIDREGIRVRFGVGSNDDIDLEGGLLSKEWKIIH